MSRTRIVKGNITKIIGGNYKRYSKDDIVNIGSKVIQVGKEGGVTYGEPEAPPSNGNIQLTRIKVEEYIKNILILRGARKKGFGLDGLLHRDLMYSDYEENDVGFEKLWLEIYNENLNNGKNKIFDSKDIARARANKVVRKIMEFCKKNDTELFENFRSNVEYYAKGKLEEVIHAMVDKMKTNKSNSSEFIDDRLNKAVNEHENHILFKKSVISVFKRELKKNSYDIDKTLKKTRN